MEMEKRLYEAALEGNVSNLKSLIQEDPLTLDRISLTFLHETPLHISILRGHFDFAKAILSHKPQLATELDSFGHSPLHLASAKGYVDIVRELLRVGPSTCLARDKDGKIPLHLAIVKGSRVEVIRELTRTCPESTRLRLDRRDTIYHLCVKSNNLEALQVLVDENDGSRIDMLSARNDDGNTILHLAALHKHLEITKYLLARQGTELINAVNNNGLTALDFVENSPRDMKGLEILNFLLEFNAQRSRTKNDHHSSITTNKASTSIVDPGSRTKSWKKLFTFASIKQLEEIRGELFMSSMIIVAITVLPIINMKVNQVDLTDEYSINSLCLVPALCILVIMISGFPLSNKFCAWIVVQLMYTALGFLGVNYLGAIISKESTYTNVNVSFVLMCIWFGLLILVSLLNMIRLVVWVVKSIHGCVKRRKQHEIRDNILSNA